MNNLVNGVFNMLSEQMPSNEQQKLLNEAIRSAGKKNNDPLIDGLKKKFNGSKLHGMSDHAREELIAKLGIFLSAAGISSIPENGKQKEFDYVPEKICPTEKTVQESAA